MLLGSIIYCSNFCRLKSHNSFSDNFVINNYSVVILRLAIFMSTSNLKSTFCCSHVRIQR